MLGLGFQPGDGWRGHPRIGTEETCWAWDFNPVMVGGDIPGCPGQKGHIGPGISTGDGWRGHPRIGTEGTCWAWDFNLVMVGPGSSHTQRQQGPAQPELFLALHDTILD